MLMPDLGNFPEGRWSEAWHGPCSVQEQGKPKRLPAGRQGTLVSRTAG